MTSLQRTLAVALVTAEVHNRDVLEVLVNKEVSHPQNFLWQAQLRWVCPLCLKTECRVKVLARIFIV